MRSIVRKTAALLVLLAMNALIFATGFSLGGVSGMLVAMMLSAPTVGAAGMVLGL